MAGFCTHCHRRLADRGVCLCTASLRSASPAPIAVPATVAPSTPRIDLVARVARRRRHLTFGVLGSIATVLVLVGLLIASTQDASTVAARPASTDRSASSGSSSGSTARSGASAASLLQDQRETDRSALAGAVGSWLPQVSSKREGTTVDGVSWTAARIWQEFERTRQQHPDTRLAWSDDWSSFRQGGYWVTVIDERYSSAAQANAWCDAQGYATDQCYAKRLTTTGGFAGNTVPRG